jgi:acetyl esterase
MPLDPIVYTFIKNAYRLGYGSLTQKTFPEVRAFLKALFRPFFNSHLSQSLLAIPSSSYSASPLHLGYRLYTPPLFLSQTPLCVWRGSAYIGGNLDLIDARCRLLAHTLKQPIIAIDYPTLPEAPYPIAFEKSLSTVEYLLSHYEELIFWGESSGATLALSSAQQLSKPLKAKIKALILWYPDLHCNGNYPSHTLYGQGYLFDNAFRQWLYHYYAPDHLPQDTRLTPLLGPMCNLPPCLLLSAQYDPMRDELYALEDRLRTAHIPVHSITFLGLTHGFLLYGSYVPAAHEALLQVIAWIQNTLTHPSQS